MLKAVKRCSICILPETAPNIAFDEKGVCNYCQSYQKFEYRGENALVRILNRHRNPQKKYECIVNISGGRDSAYALLKVKKNYKMKVLAANYENPFTNTQAKKNIKNMVKTLKVDFVKFKLGSQIHEACFRNNLIAWFKNPSPAMVPMMCIGYKIIWKHILEIAKRYGISLITDGGNPYEYTSFKKELLNVSREADLKSTYLKNLAGLVKESLKNCLYLMPQYLPALFTGYLFSNQYSISSRFYSGNIERIDLFHFIRWNEKDSVSRITKELKWNCPRKLKSTWRFDCKIGHLKNYLCMKTLAMTEKDDFYAKMVREGLMTREETLSRLERENEIHVDIIKEIFTQLGLSTKIISK